MYILLLQCFGVRTNKASFISTECRKKTDISKCKEILGGIIMPHIKYARIKKNKLLQAMRAYNLLSHSLQDWTVIIKEYNSLTLNQRNAIVQEEKLREKFLKEKLTNSDDDMYLTCSMVNLNIVASKFDIDPATVCLCIAPLCKLNESIIVV